MSKKQSGFSLIELFIVVAIILLVGGLTARPAQAQSGSTGTVTVTVEDQAGKAVVGADLALQDLATNDVRTAASQGMGTYSFVDLNVGSYRLTVSKQGFASVVFELVTVHASLVTDVTAVLKVAAASQTVEVSGSVAPLVETTSNTISSTIDLKQVEDLPLFDRDLTGLVQYTPGYANGSWNNMPGASQVVSLDGVIGQSSRFKDYGNANPGAAAASPRIQNIQEMAITTDQLDSDQGYGQGDMQATYVTRSGSNHYHGRFFADLQNSAFNANSWFNDYLETQGISAPIPLYHKNDLGGSVEGPVLKNKLFFFFSYERDDIPGKRQVDTPIMTPTMQGGIYTYQDGSGAVHQVNLYSLVPGAAPNAGVAAEVANINTSLKATGASVIPMPGVPYNAEQVQFIEPNPTYLHYPTFRVDYNATQHLRVNFAFNESTYSAPDANGQQFPGPTFAYQTAGNTSKAYTASLGFQWTIQPTLINEFHGGYLYNGSTSDENQVNDPSKFGFINWWAGPDGLNPGNGNFWFSRINNFYPLINFSDGLVWQHGSHNVGFGGDFYREQDHYWNPPLGYNNIVFGVNPGDPAFAAIQPGNPGLTTANGFQAGEMQGYYAILTGDVGILAFSRPLDNKTHAFDVPYGSWNLDELQKAWGLYFKDSWRVRPGLTVNYGLRWDFTGDDHDLQKLYYGPPAAAVWGVSGFNNVFHPGMELGNPSTFNYTGRGHAYTPWNVSPQPNVGFAWSPQSPTGFLGKLMGNGNTVLRGGYSLHRYTEQYQDFWTYASNFGAFFYQSWNDFGGPTANALGSFKAGTVSFQGASTTPTGPGYFVSPTSFQEQISEASQAYVGVGLQGMDPHIAQPYIQSWNVGIQRALGRSNAIEVRYVGNRGIHEWVGLNPNETNILENGFLTEFTHAQANLALNNASGKPQFQNSFADNGLPGQFALPIFQAAFAGEPNGPDGNFSDYTNGGFIYNLNNGQVGSLANTLAGVFTGQVSYLCNLVPTTSLTGQACTSNIGYTGAGGLYPENFFQANPYYPGGTGYLAAVGYSNYNALQVELRQKPWHGMEFTANYTYSKSLGVTQQWTLRDFGAAYAPTSTDRRHTANILGTYDLPFGMGHPFLNHNDFLDRAVGGWTLGAVVTYTTGYPFQLFGGNQTFNNMFDGGVVLNGVSASDIQNAIGLYPGPNPFTRYWINPKFLSIAGQSSLPTSQIQANTVPGSLGYHPWFYGMHHFSENVSMSKEIAIAENVKFSVQGEFLNVFNHPEWDTGNAGVQFNNFGQTGPPGGSRTIEVRANLEF